MNKDLSEQLGEIFYKEGSSLLRQHAASLPYLTNETAMELAQSSDRHIHLSLATNPGLAYSVYRSLLKKGDIEIKRALASNTGVGNRIFIKLRAEEDEELLLRLASNPSFPRGLRIILAERKDCSEAIALSLIANERLGKILQTILVKHPSERVRSFLAQHPHLYPNTLKILAEDANMKVRVAVENQLERRKSRGKKRTNL